MARQSFGKTWWGSEWLKSLTHIDYANRIPRGSAYANKGAVRSIDYPHTFIQKRTDRVVDAKVAGTTCSHFEIVESGT